jgi:hypothetical protein
VKVTTVEIKDVELPDRMQHAIARQAEAERERRAKVINAEGEFQAAARLTDAADVISRNPVAIKLRYLQTLIEVSGSKQLDDRVPAAGRHPRAADRRRRARRVAQRREARAARGGGAGRAGGARGRQRDRACQHARRRRYQRTSSWALDAHEESPAPGRHRSDRRPHRGGHGVRRRPPPGAQISDSLDYVQRVPDSAGIVEGKFDTVRGREVLVTTGIYGFRIYDVHKPEAPKLLDSFQPAEVLGRTATGRTRTWSSTRSAS